MQEPEQPSHVMQESVEPLKLGNKAADIWVVRRIDALNFFKNHRLPFVQQQLPGQSHTAHMREIMRMWQALSENGRHAFWIESLRQKSATNDRFVAQQPKPVQPAQQTTQATPAETWGPVVEENGLTPQQPLDQLQRPVVLSQQQPLLLVQQPVVLLQQQPLFLTPQPVQMPQPVQPSKGPVVEVNGIKRFKHGRRISAFNFFVRHQLPFVKQDFPQLLHHEHMRMVAEMWDCLSKEKRQEFCFDPPQSQKRHTCVQRPRKGCIAISDAAWNR